MTYGVAIKNEYDDNLVDLASGLTYYKGSSGTCILSGDAASDNIFPTARILRSNNGLQPSTIHATWVSTYDILDKINFASGGSFNSIVMRRTSPSTVDTTWYYPDPVSTNKDDLVFFKLPSDGILGVTHIWLPFTGTDKDGNSVDVGLFAQCVPSANHTGGALEYQVVSTDLPTQTSDYGVQVFDTDGTTILFDTSREVASFGDHVSITAAQAEDVIDNNTTVTLTLRKSIPNAWITAEGQSGSSYKTVYTASGATTYVLNIKQTSNTELEVTRETLSGTSLSWSSATYENFEDATFIVADFN